MKRCDWFIVSIYKYKVILNVTDQEFRISILIPTAVRQKETVKGIDSLPQIQFL